MQKRIKAEREAKLKAAAEAAENGEAPADVPPADATPDMPANSPFNLPLELDSDDDFTPIPIKEKVKEFLNKNGKEQRLPEDIVNEAFRWRLNRNDCQNRGYVLDGYPKNYRQAKAIFIVTPDGAVKKQEGEEEPPANEEEAAEALKPKLHKNIYPESVILFNASDLKLKRRARELLKANREGCKKWDINVLEGKLTVYNSENAIALFRRDLMDLIKDTTIYPTMKFFQDNQTEVFEVEFDGEQFEMFESMRIYIERFGRPYNYLKSVNYLND